ncbi:CASP-like protein [Quillaja saponaria]|uniref:CASP-like protein n=1 Tax=Quillaja saponaria TaxID=32244 RepID=A0AAD7Q6Q0_QUISA|nr:CASP-like protein [Quillaja saponaria]
MAKSTTTCFLNLGTDHHHHHHIYRLYIWLGFGIYMQLKMETSEATNTRGSRTVVLILRFLTFVFLFSSLIVLATNTATVQFQDGTQAKFKFQDVYTLRYMLATIVIGFAYNLLQMAMSIYHVIKGNHLLSGDAAYLFDFYADKVISYLLATGAAAGLGVSKDIHPILKEIVGLPLDSFFAKTNASASLLLLGFVTTAIASVFSSYSLPKKV